MKRINKILLTAAVIISLTAVTSVFGSALNIQVGNKGYMNVTKCCCEGTDGYSSSETGAYKYNKFSGELIILHMMYLASDTSGTPISDSAGNIDWIYCIQYGTSTHTENIRTATSISEMPTYASLSSFQKEGIALCTLYGNKQYFPGAAQADIYAATQTMIWEYQTGIRKIPSMNIKGSVTYLDQFLNPSHFSKMIVGKKAESIYNTMAELISVHDSIPSFCNDTVTLCYNEEKDLYEADIKDKHKCLQNFDIAVDDDSIKMTVTDNIIHFESESPLINKRANVTLTKRQPVINQAFIGLYATDSQAGIIGRCAVPVSGVLSLKSEIHDKKYRCEIIKTDSDSGDFVPGCTFEVHAADDIFSLDGTKIYSTGELVETLISDENGAASTVELYIGKYYIVETKAPEEYIVNDSKTDFSIENGDVTVSIMNEKVPETDIPDEPVPEAPASPKTPESPSIPKTSDNSSVAAFTVLMLMSSLSALLISKNKV